MQMFLFESQQSSIPQPRVDPSRTGYPPSSDFGGTSELPWVIRQKIINPENCSSGRESALISRTPEMNEPTHVCCYTGLNSLSPGLVRAGLARSYLGSSAKKIINPERVASSPPPVDLTANHAKYANMESENLFRVFSVFRGSSDFRSAGARVCDPQRLCQSRQHGNSRRISRVHEAATHRVALRLG